MAELPREERNSIVQWAIRELIMPLGQSQNTQYTQVKLRQAHKWSLAQADKQTSSDKFTSSDQQTSSGNRLGLSPEVVGR